jgi:hypothetical protein
MHEVLIPASNARDLMLDEEIVDACEKGLFKVTTVETVEDALFVLTGERWNGPMAGTSRTKPGIFARSLAALQDLCTVQSIVNLQPRALPRTSAAYRSTSARTPSAPKPAARKSPAPKSAAPKPAANKRSAPSKRRSAKP